MSAALPSHRRRSQQFSLRTLFLVMLVVGFGFMLGGKTRERMRYRQVVEELDDAGVVVELSQEAKSDVRDFDRVIGVAYRLRSSYPKFVPKPLDVSLLTNFRNLEEISLSYTAVHDVTPLKELRGIKRLKLRMTDVSDVSPLASLEDLQYLDLSVTPVTDLSPLTNLNLEVLDLSGTMVADLSPLKHVKTLRIIDLRETQVTTKQLIELEQALPACEVIRPDPTAIN